MDIFEIVKICKEAGLAIGIFGLCAWMVVFIVKRLARSIDNLVTKLDGFMVHVAKEHKDLSKQHSRAGKQHTAMMKEHKGMIEVLGRINGYKENGG